MESSKSIQQSGFLPECGVFNQCGTVLQHNPTFVLLDFWGTEVALLKERFYINGKKCSKSEWLRLCAGDRIFFDAFPSPVRRPSLKNKATCGWVGHFPDLTNRFPFRLGTDKIPSPTIVQNGPTKQMAVQVVFCPSPEISVCKINCGSFFDLSMLSQETLCRVGGRLCEAGNMANVLHVGDWVALPWESEAPARDSIPLQSQTENSDKTVTINLMNFPDAAESVDAAEAGDTAESIDVVGSSDEGNAFHSGQDQFYTTLQQNPTKICKNINNMHNFTDANESMTTVGSIDEGHNAKEFQPKGFAKTCEEIPDCIFSKEGESGLFSHLKAPDTGVILYKGYELTFHEKDCFFNDLKWNDLLEKEDLHLKFEAVKLETSDESDPGKYKILCVWNRKKPSIRDRVERLNTYNDFSIKDGERLTGTVLSFSLRTAAFVGVERSNGIVFLVVFANCVRPQIPTNCCISSALKIGDIVQLTAKMEKYFWCGFYVIVKPSNLSHSICPTTSKLDSDLTDIKSQVRCCGKKYSEGVGTLAMKLSADEAIFLVTDVKKKKKKQQKPYAVYIKRAGFFVDGAQCQNLSNLSGKKFRILSSRTTGNLPEGAVLCAVSQQGICALSLDCDILSVCNHNSSVSLDMSHIYTGKVKQYLCFDALMVECIIGEDLIHVLLESSALIVSPRKKKFIGCHLKIGDCVTMKLCNVIHGNKSETYKANIAVIGQSMEFTASHLQDRKIASAVKSRRKSRALPEIKSEHEEDNKCDTKFEQHESSSQDNKGKCTITLQPYVISSGKITQCLTANQGIVTSETGERVLISIDVLFYNGEPCQNLTIYDILDTFVVDFEATVQPEAEHYDYIAECAWIKRKSSIADLLNSKLYLKKPLQDFDMSGAYVGVVQDLIPPKFSIVSFEPPNVGHVNALLPVEALTSPEINVIQNIIRVGDSVSIEIKEKNVGGKYPVMFVTKASVVAEQESKLSSCFSRLLHMSGKVVELHNNFEGIIQVDVLKLRVKFSLRNVVFWDYQDDERDKVLPEFMPVGTFLMFNAIKEPSSNCSSFRATKVWKPVCIPDPS